MSALPTDRPSARSERPHAQMLDRSPISCFNFIMEILSLGIDRAPGGKIPRAYAVGFRSISRRPPPPSMIVNTFPRS